MELKQFSLPLPVALLVLLILFGLAAAIMQTTTPRVSIEQKKSALVRIGSTEVSAEVVNIPAARERGLSGHAPLGASEGMLFVFDKEDEHGFWMKDMLFSIDIIWIDSSYNIVSIKENATPESYPEVFYPASPVKYVLEVSAGFAATHSIAEGSKVVVEY